MFSFSKVLPLVTELGKYLQMGVEFYAEQKKSGKPVDPDVVAAMLRMKISGWDPKIGKSSLLDDPTRDAAARFLAGVACNLTGV